MEIDDEGERCYLCGRPPDRQILYHGKAIAICERCGNGLVKGVAVRCGCGRVFRFPREIAALGYISKKTGTDWIEKALSGEPLIVPIYGCDECLGFETMVWQKSLAVYIGRLVLYAALPAHWVSQRNEFFTEGAVATGDSHEPWAIYEILDGFGRRVEIPGSRQGTN
ncbi:MAG: hypothetical protein HY813_03010 [Candidatus Portnoybacteria bacterium]|nr:hypothetical protein [Candidatus Portnoybacteria bacterium]